MGIPYHNEDEFADASTFSDAPAPKGMHDYFRWVVQRFWIPLLLLLSGWLLGLFVYSNTPKTYESAATIDIQRVKREAAEVDEEGRLTTSVTAEMLSTAERLKTPALYARIAGSEAFADREDIVFKKLKLPWQEATAASTAELGPEDASGMMRDWVSVRWRRDTTLIDLSARHSDPEIARDLLVSLIAEYEKSTEQRVAGSSEYALDYILKSSSEIKERLLEIENTVRLYNRCLELSTEIRAAERDIADMEKRYLPKWPALVEAKQLRDILRSRFQSELDQMLRLSEEERDYWAANQAALEGLPEDGLVDAKINLVSARSTVLTREREAEQQIYDNLITKLKEGNLLQDFEGKQFEVIQPPTPADAVAPDKQKILLASTLGGFALGVGIVILLGLIDPTIRTVSDLETFTELPVIGVFPRWKSDQRKADKAERQTIASSLEDTPENSSSMEAVRTLRAGLTFLGDREERCTFAITSAIAAEGKSWVASNLALSFAKQGDRTLLIDADLRRPVQARIFGYDADSPGLTDHLSGNAELKNVIRRSEVSDQLYLLGAGSRSANPAELLAGKNLPALLQQLGKHFDRVVIDSAPLIPVSDTVPIARLVHSVVLVCRIGKTPKGAIRRAIKVLTANRALPVGVVANDLPRTKTKGAYGYYYSYYGSGEGGYGGYGAEKS